MTWMKSITRPADPAHTFVLLNVLGFPVAAYVATLVVRGLAILQAPAIALVAVVTGAGLVLLAINIWLTWAAARSRASGASIAAMAAWTLACAATLVLLGAYSPLTLALNFAFGGLVRFG